ncbi:MAG: hypothetical protein EOP00_21305 [Pedobacter sp.]|nr:MAG: hypothetical protein EOP00_21305 [Pedobacter sp.]
MKQDFSKTKHFDTEEEAMIAFLNMGKFQKLHNHLKEAFIGLLNITKTYKEDNSEYKLLTRSCLIELFGLIEADIFYYDVLDKHPDPKRKIDFFKKISLTFNQIGKTWGKEKIIQSYFSTQLELLKKLRKKRNAHVHPKVIDDLFEPTKEDLEDITVCFEQYDLFINNIMNNFFIGYKINLFK